VNQAGPAPTQIEGELAPAAVAAGRLANLRDYGVCLATAALFVVLSLSSENFLSSANLLNILDQWAPIAIMACGGTIVLIVGGFDLSIAGIFVLGAVVSAKLSADGGVIIGMLCGIAVGGLAGALNGLITTLGRINAFVTTIVTAIAFTGLASIITGGFLISVPSTTFGVPGQNELLGLKLSVWIFAAFALTLTFVLTRTSFGRHVYATGGNREAARLSGLRTRTITLACYVISGVSGGLAGLLVASRTQTASADMGGNTQYYVFAAMLVGGNSAWGGEGAIWRTVVGVALIALIGNGFNLLGVDPLYQQLATAGIILTAVIVDAFARRRDAG
jgi:ribose transport system permease protein